MPARFVAAVVIAAGSTGVAIWSGGAAAAPPSTPTPTPTPLFTARRLRPRAGALRPGTLLPARALFGDRVFATARIGFALADARSAQYPARTVDGGRSWRVDGPQLHVDAADGPEAVDSVGVAGPRTFYAYGSSAIDVTTDAGRSWWEAFAPELVVAVVPGPRELIAFVEQSVSTAAPNPAVTWQYVSRDGGRHWRYSTALGGL